MMAVRRLFSRLLSSSSRRESDERLKEELEFHIQMQAEEHVRAGLTPEEARRRSVLDFGPIEAIKESYRDEERLLLVDEFIRDVRYAFRQLRHTPVFTLTAIVSLAMGIGANAAVFTILERLLLRPLPVNDPRQLVFVTDDRILTQPSPRFSYPFYAIVRENTVLSGVAARAAIALNVTSDGRTMRANAELVSGNYFDVLGVTSDLGRPLSAADDTKPGAHPVAVISEAFWKRTFASDSWIVGRPLSLNGTSFTIVGVAANGFTGTEVGLPAEIWIPLAMQREVGRNLLTDARTNWLEMVGRLRSGDSRHRAGDALIRDVQHRLAELPGQLSTPRLALVPAEKGSSPAREEQQPALLVTFALTGLALTLASINVAALAAVRSAEREREMAIRLAVGASRLRLARQLLTESVVLAALGAGAALLIAPWTARVLAATYAAHLADELSLGPRVLALVAVAGLFASVIVASLPLALSRRIRLGPASGSSGVLVETASRRVTAHDLMVALQIAVALAMLISAGLLVQSLRELKSVEPGFRADHLLLATLDPRAAGYDASRIWEFWRTVLDSAKATSGVECVSIARTTPLSPGRQRQPWQNPTSGEKLEVDTNFVGPQYFRTLGIPVVGGREFDDDDRRGSRPVVVVNERLARIFWPQQDPIGKTIRIPEGANPFAEVVGVVRDVKYRDLRDEAVPVFYRPALQTHSTDSLVLHVRTQAAPDLVITPVRHAIQAIDANVPIFQITTLEEQLDASFATTRQAAVLAGSFSILALLLSGIGVYGITALAVSRRTRDIGVRMALGATRRHIIQSIGTPVVALIGIGLALGLAGSFVFARVTGTLLFRVSPGDAPTFVSMAALLAAVSLLAFLIPVRKATRLDAVAAIRQQ